MTESQTWILDWTASLSSVAVSVVTKILFVDAATVDLGILRAWLVLPLPPGESIGEQKNPKVTLGNRTHNNARAVHIEHNIPLNIIISTAATVLGSIRFIQIYSQFPATIIVQYSRYA